MRRRWGRAGSWVRQVPREASRLFRGPLSLCRTSSGLWAASVAAVRGEGEITGGKEEVTDAGHEGLYIHCTCESPKQGQTLLPHVCARTTFSSQRSATLRPLGVCTRSVSRFYHSSSLCFSAPAIYFLLAFPRDENADTMLEAVGRETILESPLRVGCSVSAYAKCGEK